MATPTPAGSSCTRGSLARLCGGLALVAGLLAAASPAAQARHQAAAFTDAGTLSIASNGTPADLDPASNQSDSADMIDRNIAEALLRPDGASMERVVPDLATSYEANADKSVWTFHLRHGVKFHTGRCCMTADDVRYSIGAHRARPTWPRPMSSAGS